MEVVPFAVPPEVLEGVAAGVGPPIGNLVLALLPMEGMSCSPNPGNVKSESAHLAFMCTFQQLSVSRSPQSIIHVPGLLLLRITSGALNR